MTLNTVWFVLIAMLYMGFFVLEGFDFGVGILLPFLSRDKDPQAVDRKRRVMINTMNYYVNAVDNDTISLHTTLANAQGTISPVTFTAPIVALLTPMLDGWCVDNDRFIAGGEYIGNIYSSYDIGSFSNTSDDPKDSHLTEGGISPINTSMVPASTNTTTDQLTFTTNHGWATQQAVQVTAPEGGLSAGTTYYVRSINANTVSFHPTAAAANNAGPAPAAASGGPGSAAAGGHSSSR